MLKNLSDLVQIGCDNSLAHCHVLKYLSRRTKEGRTIPIWHVRRGQDVTGCQVWWPLVLRDEPCQNAKLRRIESGELLLHLGHVYPITNQ